MREFKPEDLVHAQDGPKYREPPALVVRINRYGCIFHPLYESLYNKKQKVYKPIGFRVKKKHVEDSYFPFDLIHPLNNSKIPPWELIKSEVDMSLSEFETLLNKITKWPN